MQQGRDILSESYADIGAELIRSSRQPREVSKHDVYQEANKRSRKLVEKIIAELILPGSTILNFNALKRLLNLSKQGKACLVLMEHYSNFDVPGLYYLMREYGDTGEAVGDSLVAMSALKLNKESRFVLAFTEAYTRIVIFPARRLAELFTQKSNKEQEQELERKQAREINRAALRCLARLKHDGRMIIMFPTGTRFKPDQPETKKILREVYSYIKRFDYMVFVGIAGQVLRVNDPNDMSSDFPAHDVMVYSISPVYKCGRFCKEAKEKDKDAGSESDEDSVGKRIAVAQAVQNSLHEMHVIAEQRRNAARNQSSTD